MKFILQTISLLLLTGVAFSSVSLEIKAQSAGEQLAGLGIKANSKSLIYRAGKGEKRIVGLLLEAGISPNLKGKGGVTPLYQAARNGHVIVARMLLLRGANLEARNDFQNTALIAAVYRNQGEMTALLLKKKAAVNAQNKVGDTALHMAAANGNDRIVRNLLGRAANASVKNGKGETPAQVAQRRKHGKIAQRLTSKDIVSAAWLGDLERVRAELGQGVDINTISKKGWGQSGGITALMAAAWRGHGAVVEYLVNKGADVNFPSKKPPKMADEMRFFPSTALEKAVGQGRTEMAEFLVSKKARVSDRFFALMVRGGDANIISLMLRSGVNVNHAVDTHDGNITAFTSAVGEGSIKMVKMMLRYGADVDFRIDGLTPLNLVTKYGERAMAKILLRAGANPNLQNKTGVTPLMEAAKRSHSSLVRLLLKYGADPRLIDLKGRNTIDYANASRKSASAKKRTLRALR